MSTTHQDDAGSLGARPTVERPAGRRAAGRELLWAGLVLAGVVLGTHIWALGDGLFFDDHWHRANVREKSWSFHDLTESATFSLPSRLTSLWWQEHPLLWRFTRPVAMALFKAQYLLVDGDPVLTHAFSILWHYATCLLVFLLARWAMGDWRWALLAGCLFAFNPHSVFTVSWSAAHNAIASAFFFLAAVLLYTRASFDGDTPRARVRLGWLAAAIALWGLGVFSRESAIVWPVIVAALDLSLGGRRHVLRRWPVYLVLTALTLAFVYYRLVVFPQRATPEIYFTAPHGLAYVGFVLGKLLYLVFTQIFYTPMFLGLASYGDEPASAHLGAYTFMLVVVGLITAWYAWAARGQRAALVWPTWVVAGYLPVIPVIVMPHFAYLPAAAYFIMLAIMLRRLRGRLRVIVMLLVIAPTLWTHGIYRVAWRGVVAAEQVIVEDIALHTPRPAPESKLFLINLPVAGIYTVEALQERWRAGGLAGYVLTFAPHPLRMDARFTLEQVGPRELVLGTEPPGYFAGHSGRMLVGGMRAGALAAGTVVRGEAFDVTVLEADEQGVTKLKFTFSEPLDSPAYLFFASTPDRPAARLRLALGQPVRFDPPGSEYERRVGPLLAAREHFFRLIRLTQRFVRADLYLTNTDN